jgi:hypothetical protein
MQGYRPEGRTTNENPLVSSGELLDAILQATPIDTPSSPAHVIWPLCRRTLHGTDHGPDGHPIPKYRIIHAHYTCLLYALVVDPCRASHDSTSR